MWGGKWAESFKDEKVRYLNTDENNWDGYDMQELCPRQNINWKI